MQSYVKNLTRKISKISKIRKVAGRANVFQKPKKSLKPTTAKIKTKFISHLVITQRQFH